MRTSAMFTTIFMVLAALNFTACGDHDEAQTQTPSPEHSLNALVLSAKELQQAGISVESVKLQRVTKEVTLTGTIVPDQMRIAKVLPALPGRIEEVRVKQGDNVGEGQVLVILESIELGEARAAYRQAKSEAVLADAAFNRAKQLSVETIVPKKEYLGAKADAERAHAALEAAISKLQLLHVMPVTGNGQENDAAYPLTAPFSGTIIEQAAVRGELARTDQSLFTVADLSTVWIEADVFERDIDALEIGSPARITVAAYPGQEFEGKLIYVSDTMDVVTRTIKARIAAGNSDRKLKAGMFVDVVLESQSAASQALIVPAQAVTLIQGQTTVFVNDGQGFDIRPVETESTGYGKVRIETGLKAGERIAVSGVYELKARLLKSQIGSDD